VKKKTVAIFSKMVKNTFAAFSAEYSYGIILLQKLSNMRRPIAVSAEKRLSFKVFWEML